MDTFSEISKNTQSIVIVSNSNNLFIIVTLCIQTLKKDIVYIEIVNKHPAHWTYKSL